MLWFEKFPSSDSFITSRAVLGKMHRKGLTQKEYKALRNYLFSWVGVDSSTSVLLITWVPPEALSCRASRLHEGTDVFAHPVCVYASSVILSVQLCVYVYEYNTWEAHTIDVLLGISRCHCKGLCVSKLWSSLVCLFVCVCRFVSIQNCGSCFVAVLCTTSVCELVSKYFGHK